VNIAIVTPWQNHLELADDYFEAVLPEMEEGDELLIVDNASEPPLKFAALRAEENLGFAKGSNRGLVWAGTEAVLFLNNDIAPGKPGWLETIRKSLEPGVLCGPLRDGPHTAVDGVQFPYLDGWCLAGMREDLLALDGFDESLMEPSYYSDNLLCLEARKAGMTLRNVRTSLLHKENATAGPASDASVSRAFQHNAQIYRAACRSILQAA
jgi:GT2 family glycosyltransferase